MKLYPTVDQPPRFNGLPKIHKANIYKRGVVKTSGHYSE